MRVLIIEDEDDKYEAFAAAFAENGISSDTIVRIDNLSDFFKHTPKLAQYDLCLLDFYLPFRKDESQVQNCMSDIFGTLDASYMASIPVLAITRHAGDPNFDDADARSRGILAYDFGKEHIWKVAVQSFISKAKGRHKYDFVGVLALDSERQGFLRVPELKISRKKIIGLDAWEVQIGGLSGCLFCLPKMGLVDAAIGTSRIMENFSPKIAFMSGICGGSADTEMGQLLFTEFCWEYQSGKWIADGFQSNPYQEGIPEILKSDISFFINDEGEFLKGVEENIGDLNRPSKPQQPSMAIFSSGSAVVASTAQMEKIKVQHGKVKGIDMEIFAFHRCMNLLENPITHFSCKVVVDKANEAKDDRFHEYGCAVSAIAAIKVIQDVIFPRL